MTDQEVLGLLIDFSFGCAVIEDRRIVLDSAPSNAETYSMMQRRERLKPVSQGIAEQFEKIAGPGTHDPELCYRRMLADLEQAAHDRDVTLRERERCAKIADEHSPDCDGNGCDLHRHKDSERRMKRVSGKSNPQSL